MTIIDPRVDRHDGWVWRLERALAEALAADARRRAERCALRRALAAFTAHHPHWAASGCDPDLLARPDGAAALAAHDAAALARAWTRRFRYRDERRRERDVRRLEPVAGHLLALLEGERARLGQRGTESAAPAAARSGLVSGPAPPQ